MAPPVFPISTAQQKLFDLFHAVTSRHGRKVIITSRGAASHAALVGETYLKELESAAKRLRAIEASRGVTAYSFKLVGSGRVAAAVEDPVGQTRLEDTAAVEIKLAFSASARTGHTVVYRGIKIAPMTGSRSQTARAIRDALRTVVKRRH